jgi:hypothetical protein
MADLHKGPEQLDGRAVMDFIAMRRSEGFKRVGTLGSIGKLLAYLQVIGVNAEGPRPPATELDLLLKEYEQWLIAKRAVAPRTVLRYSALARKFLAARVSSSDALGVTGRDGGVVARFLLDEFARLSPGSAKGRVTELRSLLRVLALKGLTQLSLGDSGPPVAGWREKAIPRTVPPATWRACWPIASARLCLAAETSPYRWCCRASASAPPRWPGWSSREGVPVRAGCITSHCRHWDSGKCDVAVAAAAVYAPDASIPTCQILRRCACRVCSTVVTDVSDSPELPGACAASSTGAAGYTEKVEE